MPNSFRSSRDAVENAGSRFPRLYRVPRLLFATHPGRLADNIGRLEAAAVLDAIRDAGHIVVETPAEGRPAATIRQALQSAKVAGVVILGGYDVIPAERYDTLPPRVRGKLSNPAESDVDDFIVWSDQVYGDVDGDGLADIPVSRLPDGRSSQLVTAALGGSGAPANVTRFGIRNVARPFAEPIFASIAGSSAMAISKPTAARELGVNDVTASKVYLMLHGSDADVSRYWGEKSGGMLEALSIRNVPEGCDVVFSGCCWGALTVKTKASDYREGDPLSPVIPEASVALSFLSKGARAYVGCTGAHYSPLAGDFDYFGGPMHRSFWAAMQAGAAPAEALFKAKLEFIARLPHGARTWEEIAVEHKVLREFTCLGLGW